MWTYNYSDELYHYGIKGMKWGVRRYQNKDGTLTAAGKAKYGSDISQRKVKHVKKQFQTGLKTKSIDMEPLHSKVRKEVHQSKEGKALSNVQKYFDAIYKQAESQGISRSQVVFDKATADWYNGLNDAYSKKLTETAKKYVDEYASVTLKSLGYEDTKAGREWLKKQNFMDW